MRFTLLLLAWASWGACTPPVSALRGGKRDANDTGLVVDNVSHKDDEEAWWWKSQLTTSKMRTEHGGSFLWNHALLNETGARRQLIADHEYFEPLNCNSPKCNGGTLTWKQKNFNPNAGKVVINCGECVTMNYDASDTLYLPNGLDVQGSLKFPNGYRLTIVTPFVLVQGELEMYATRKVSGEPNIKFVLTGTNQAITQFVPAGQNRMACSSVGATNPRACALGRKPFVVAGGKVTIRGLPPTCPTWVNLQEVLTGDMPDPDTFAQLPTEPRTRSNPRCITTTGVYMEDDFDTTDNVHGWTGGYGAFSQVSQDGTFVVWNRKDALNQAPTWDMLHIRDCLLADQPYLFRARLKLTKAGAPTGTLTTCATSGNNCVTLQSTVRTPNNQIGRRKGWEVQLEQSQYGVWLDFYAIVEYTAAELDPDNIYQILQLRGPEAGVIMEMDDVRFSLPQEDAVPNPKAVCAGNLVQNGDAELDAVHPYPIDNFGGHLTVEEEAGSGNQYFHLSGRSGNAHTIFYELMAPDCLTPNGKYKASAKIRMGSTTGRSSKMEIRTRRKDGSVIQRAVAECPPSTSDGWTLCESVFTADMELIGNNVDSIRLQFETYGAANIDMDVDDIQLTFQDGSINAILVPDDGVSACWDAGAEILITSHTLNFDDAQVRRLVAPPIPQGDGFVKLELNETLVPPTSAKQSPEFAVEVALLSRNIVFEGDTDDPDELLGAHFMVMQTPHVDQLIEGIEFRNFGQQGILGKYPIHFHLCGDVNGAIVSKNSIRDSKQRCVVVHGSHNLTIDSNVAYDHFGHCYMTEDGGEVDNVFVGNLGAGTKPARRLVSSIETDGIPSTFWCSNPSNEWIRNVAAGSRDNGFWFELLQQVRGPTATMPLSSGMNPRALPLGSFRDNVAHSNGKHGVRTYPHGFFPPEEAVFYNTRSFKNKWDGVFFHNSRNLAVEGGILANNEIQIDFDRADNIRMVGTSLVGVSDEYKGILSSQQDAPAHTGNVIGLELHGFTTSMDRSGATIRDVKFSGFSDTGSSRSALIAVDDAVENGHFDFWTTLQGMQFESGITPRQFAFSRALAAGTSGIYITDLDSSMKPTGGATTGVSTVISDTPDLTHFLDTGNCEGFAGQGYMYCENTCLRTILFTVDPAETHDFVLRVTEEANPSNRFDFPSKYYYENVGENGPLDDIANSWIRKGRYFAVTLPAGKTYVARFRTSSGQAWPTHAEVTVENEQCPNDISGDAVRLVPPAPSPGECQNLIKNGDMEMSDNAFPHWLHHHGRLELARGKGIGSNSNALSDFDQTMSSRLIGQYLDTRCLVAGRQYEIKVWMKLERNGSPTSCDMANGCPRARLRVRTPNDEDGSSYRQQNIDISDYFVRPYQPGGWNLLQSVFTVDSTISAASSVLFFVEPRISRVKTYVDNVSVTLLPEDCTQLVLNGNFDQGASSFWERNVDNNNVKMSVVTIGGSKALKMTGRSSLSHSPIQDTRTGCMDLAERFLVTARVRLTNTDGSLFECNPTRTANNLSCPRIRMRSFINVGLPSQEVKAHDGGSIAITDQGKTQDGWYTVSGTFNANEFDAAGERHSLYFDQVSSGKDFLIDDVSITPLPLNCNELLINGDGEYGPTPSFWRHWINGGNEKIDLVSMGGSKAFKISERPNAGDGMHQFIDSRCLALNSEWKLTAKMKIVNKRTGAGVTCDPADTRITPGCPPIRIAGWSGNSKVTDQKFSMTNSGITWAANSFNTYEVVFPINQILANADRVSLALRNWNFDWDVIVDDISLGPA